MARVHLAEEVFRHSDNRKAGNCRRTLVLEIPTRSQRDRVVREGHGLLAPGADGGGRNESLTVPS